MNLVMPGEVCQCPANARATDSLRAVEIRRRGALRFLPGVSTDDDEAEVSAAEIQRAGDEPLGAVERMDVYRVDVPTVAPFRVSFGIARSFESVVVRLQAGTRVGWAEAAPWRYPSYSPESTAGVFLALREFIAPLVLGQRFESGEAIQSRLSCFKGNQFAKSAIDLAWWDLYAKSRGEPLWKTLGGRSPAVDVGADFGVMDSLDDLLRVIDSAVKDGMKRVKLKCMPGWDLDMVAAVRKAFPKLVFHVDANSAYTLDDLPMFKKLDRHGLAMIEQPLAHDDLMDHAELQRQLETPICLDESITSPAKARKAAAIGACRFVNIKAGRVGGLTNAIKVHDVCMDAGISCWVGGMVASALESGFAMAIATLPNCGKYPSDIFPRSRFYAEDLCDPAVEFSAPSQVTATDQPGIGVTPNPERLAKWTVDQFSGVP